MKPMAFDEMMDQRMNWIRAHMWPIEQRTSPDNTSIFVCRFMPQLGEWHVRQLFSFCGVITFVAVLPKAFRVEFATKQMATFAIWSMHGKYWVNTNTKIICNWWKWSNETPKNQSFNKQLLPNAPLSVEKVQKITVEQQENGGRTEGKIHNLPLAVSSVLPLPAPSPAVENGQKTNVGQKAQQKERRTEDLILNLPLTNRSVLSLPPAPSFDECLSASESEMANEMPTEAAKLAEEFATKNLTTKERMEALLRLLNRSNSPDWTEEEEEKE